MPEYFSMTFVLAVFYVVFFGQIFLLSIYYPRKISGRVEHMLNNFPPSEYPKLYPSFHSESVKIEQFKMKVYKLINYAIALVGLGLLVAMVLSGYRPAETGGDETFVMLYFFLQTIPLLYISWKEHCQYRLMRLTFDDKKRVADLKRRGLFDFVSPVYVVTAVLFHVAWLAFFIDSAGPVSAWESNHYVTLVVISGMNILYAVTIFSFASGKKLDPYKAPKDQMKHAESVIKVLVFSSILISVFLSITQAADQYAFEVFDPVLTSFYMQLCVIFGLGLVMKMQNIEEIDFEVYREQDTEVSAIAETN